MKWSSRKPRADYYAWRDIGLTMLVAAIIAIAIVLLIALFVLCLAPRNATAGDVTNFRTARRLAPVTLRLDKATSRVSSSVVRVLLMEVSAYSPMVQECDATPLITASGKRVYVGGVAADLDVLPFGSRVIVPGYNGGEPCQVVDTGSAIQGNKLDVFFFSTDEAIHWGRRKNVRVEVLCRTKAKP